MTWQKYSTEQIKEIIYGALENNLNYRDSIILGLPGSFLDPKVFYVNAPFLNEAPFLNTMVANPNHIGCHTIGESEPVFKGTQHIEKDLIEMCATGIFDAKPNTVDGYVASGGTEANIQGFWILRNYYTSKYGARNDEIGLVFSDDCHYSMPKSTNLLNITGIRVNVDNNSRNVDLIDLENKILAARKDGIKYFIVVINMSTTMFGSIDNIDHITASLKKLDVQYKIHVDAAYGGFIYPFIAEHNKLTFNHPDITSFSLDGHKMLLSPYGTGIFLVKKGMMQFAMTDEANYVKGKDYTLIGSRSGANAIAIWMIMRTYGYDGWKEKIKLLSERTRWLCDQLDHRGIDYFNHAGMNIITIPNGQISAEICEQYYLVPDNHHGGINWWKIVVMDHVQQEHLEKFLDEIDKAKITI